MALRPEPIGIVSVGTHLPERVVTASEIATASGIPEAVVVEKLGITRKHVAGPDDHPNEMAALAALDCLSRSEIPASEIDVVLCTTEEWKEYLLWSAGIDLAHRIGADRAWAMDVHMRCAGTVGAMKVARDMMRSDPEIRTVLIAGGYRVSDFIDLSNPRTSFMYNIGSGAGAMLLRRGWERNEVLGSHVIADGSLSRSVVVPGSGTMGGGAGGGAPLAFDVLEPERMKERLDARSMENWVRCVDEALRKSGGLSRGDIDFLDILLIKPSGHREMLRRLGLREDQAVYLGEVGHIGEQDAMFGIREGLAAGRLKDGDLMVIVAAGIGYVWAAGVVRWGPIAGPDDARRDR